jgi:acyl dehydratase
MTTWKRRALAPLTRHQILQYASAVDDFNPIHVDDEFARSTGLPSVIAHGPLTAALIIDAIAAQLGVERLRAADIRLKAPVFPDEELVVEPSEDGAIVLNADGTVVANAILEVRSDV